MDELERKVDKLEISMNNIETASIKSEESIAKMADSINELVKLSVKTAEQNKRQTEVNDEQRASIKTLEKDVYDIKLARATESASRHWLSKYYPWLLVVGAIGLLIVANVVRNLNILN